jgi:predicted HD superfamily hydrolase involved in NAD metabolism
VPESIADLKTALQARLKPSRYEHSLSVASEARRIAGLYDVDTEAAYLAGLLHDWDKCLDDEELIARAGRYGIAIPGDPREMARLLHAAVGAVDLEQAFPWLSPAILQAISRHTSAAEDMAPLDMVIYIADMIEPLRDGRMRRDGDDLTPLRQLVGQVSLERLFFTCLGYLIVYLVERHSLIAPGTLEVWNAYVRRLGGRTQA